MMPCCEQNTQTNERTDTCPPQLCMVDVTEKASYFARNGIWTSQHLEGSVMMEEINDVLFRSRFLERGPVGVANWPWSKPVRNPIGWSKTYERCYCIFVVFCNTIVLNEKTRNMVKSN